MTVPPSPPDLDALLAHSGWVRALARNLVVDPFAAEDAGQQAWVTALENPPKHGGNLRSWWGAVVRSSAGKGWREQKRRREVTHGAALEEAQSGAASPSAIAEKLDTFQRLARAVSQLPEPYRTVIYLRYIEELSVREVAKRQSVPVPTAQSHIQRGLEKLRTNLQENMGAQWRSRCLVFALPLPSAPWLTLGPAAILAMKTKTILSAAGAILALATLAIWAPWDDSEPALNDSLLSAAQLEDGLQKGKPTLPATTGQADLTADAPLTRETQSAAAPAPETERFEVQVLHAQSLQPAPHAVVHVWDYTTRDPEDYKILRKEKPDAITAVQRFGVEYQADENGFLAIPMTGGRYQITASADGRFAYHWSFEKPNQGETLELLLRKEIVLHVKVTDQDGNAAVGVPIGFSPEPQRYASHPRREVLTDQQGRAQLRHLEADVEIDDVGLCTTALLVPSAPPQVQETPAAELANHELHFIMPQVGSVLVTATAADGTPLKDGTPITLQLSDDIARAAASGKQQVGQYESFSGRLGLSVATAYVRNGVAKFPRVGVNTEVAIGKYDWDQNGYVVRVLQGPSFAGEVITTDLTLAPPPQKVHVSFQSTPGRPLSARSLGVTLSWVDRAKKSFGIGKELSVNEQGVALLSLPKAIQEARALLLTTSSLDFQMPQDKPSQIEVGALVISEKMLAEEELRWTVQQGGTTLLAGQVLDETGQPFAECELTLGLRLDDSTQLGFLSDYWEFATDADGRFRVEGPLVVPGMHWALTANSRDMGRTAMGTDLPFSPGDDAASFVVARSKHLSGRLMVDDPAQLAQLELILYAGPAGKPGSYYYSLDLNPVNGRFQSRRLDDAAYSLVLRSRGTHEQLGILPSALTKAEPNGNVYQLPDWDFRGKLHQHHLRVKAASGKTLEEISITLANVKEARTKFRPTDLRFLSTQLMLPMSVGAFGYRNQEIVLAGELEVALQDGIPVQIDFSTALPATDGILWQAAWMELRVPTQYPDGTTYVGPRWVTVTGSQASLTVPDSGSWTFLLRAAPSQETARTANAGVLSLNRNPPVVEVGVTGAQLSVTIQVEDFNRALDEVRAWQKE